MRRRLSLVVLVALNAVAAVAAVALAAACGSRATPSGGHPAGSVLPCRVDDRREVPVARFPGFDAAIGVGPRLVLVGCTSLRILAPGAQAKDVALLPASYSPTCIEVRGSFEDRLFVELERKLYVVDVARGGVAWTSGEEPVWRATLAGPVVATLTGEGRGAILTGRDGASGARLWSAAHPFADSEDPTQDVSVHGAGATIVERVATGTDGTLVATALRARSSATGRVTWETPLTVAGARSIEDLTLASLPDTSDAADAGALFALGSFSGGPDVRETWLVELELRTGKVRRAARVSKGGAMRKPSLVTAGGALYVVDADSTSRLGRDGTIEWTAKVSYGFAMVAAGDVLYVGDSAANLRALEARTGSVVWSFRLDAANDAGGWSPVQVAAVPDLAGSGRTLLAAGTSDGVTLFDRSDRGSCEPPRP